MLESAMGSRPPYLDYVYRHEARYFALEALIRKRAIDIKLMAEIVGSFYSSLACFLMIAVADKPFWPTLPIAALAGLGCNWYLKSVRAETGGYINRLRNPSGSDPTLAMIFAYGVLMYAMSAFLKDVEADGASFAFAAAGALAASTCLSALITVRYLKWMNTARQHFFSATIPLEAIVHRLTSSLLLIKTSRNLRFSLSGQQRLCANLELIAFTLERRVNGRLIAGDRWTSRQVKHRMQQSANYLRDLKRWIATPRQDTYSQLADRLIEAIEFSASGSWDNFPTPTHQPARSSPLMDAILGVAVIILAASSIALMAWAASRLPGLNVGAVAVLITPLVPLLASYLNSTVLPSLASRRPIT